MWHFQKDNVLLQEICLFAFANAAIDPDEGCRAEMSSQGQTVVKQTQPTAVAHDA